MRHSTDYSGAGIYALFNAIDDIVYIGKSANIKQRFTAHRSLFASKSSVSAMDSKPITDFVFMILYKMNDDEFKKYGHIAEIIYICELSRDYKLYNGCPKNGAELIRGYIADIFKPKDHFNNAFYENAGIKPYYLNRASPRRRKEILDLYKKEGQA